MGYITNVADIIRVGDWAVTVRKCECVNGHFDAGTKVKVIGVGSYGYDIEDEQGNQMFDVWFDALKPV